MKYIIKLESGKYIEKFFASGIVTTSDIKLARKYSKSDAIKRIAKWDLKAELIN